MAKQTTIALSDEALSKLKGRYGADFKTERYAGARFVDQGTVEKVGAMGEEDRVRTWRDGMVNAAKSQADENVQLTLMLYDSADGYRARQASLKSSDEEQAQASLNAAAGNRFNTALPPEDEGRFASWKSKVAPKDSGEDYDFRGAWLAGEKPGASGHWTDRFKKPNHPTFSTESQYAQFAPGKAGTWAGETYLPAVDVMALRYGLDSARAEASRARSRVARLSPLSAPYEEPADITAIRNMNWGG